MLSDEEIQLKQPHIKHIGLHAFARDIEKAVLAKVTSDRQPDASDRPLKVNDVVIECGLDLKVIKVDDDDYLCKVKTLNGYTRWTGGNYLESLPRKEKS